MTMSPQDLQTLFSCSCSFSMSPQDLHFRSGRRANDDESPGLANPISCSFRMSSISGDFLLVDGAPSARRLESEADVESEVGVESEAGVGTEKPLSVRDLARKAAQRNSW